MTQSCQQGFFPNGLSPCLVDTHSGEIVDYAFDNWRTYQSAPYGVFEENSDADVWGYVFCETFSQSKLSKLFRLEDRFHNRYFGNFTEMMFKTHTAVDLLQIRSIFNDIDDFQEVYTWIPTDAVLLGRRICLASIHSWAPHCKIVGVTDDDGKIRKVMVTIFFTADSLSRDLSKEMAFYHGRHGKYKINFELDIKGIVFPRPPRYRD